MLDQEIKNLSNNSDEVTKVYDKINSEIQQLRKDLSDNNIMQ